MSGSTPGEADMGYQEVRDELGRGIPYRWSKEPGVMLVGSDVLERWVRTALTLLDDQHDRAEREGGELAASPGEGAATVRGCEWCMPVALRYPKTHQGRLPVHTR